MFIRDLKNCREFIAGDGAILRELFHPGKADLELRCSLAHARVMPGEITGRHRLKVSEVYYILKGQGVMYIDEESVHVGPGQAVYIPPNAIQCIRNTEDSELTFLCIVDPAWQPEDEEIL